MCRWLNQRTVVYGVRVQQQQQQQWQVHDFGSCVQGDLQHTLLVGPVLCCCAAVLWLAAALPAACLSCAAWFLCPAALRVRPCCVCRLAVIVASSTCHQAQAQREELIKQDVTQIMKTFYCQVRISR
jgi:hypothetical protein